MRTAVKAAAAKLTLLAQVIICTAIKDTVEFLDHIMLVTNMSCLTPRTLLQVQIHVFARSALSFCRTVPLLILLPDWLPLCRRQPLRQECTSFSNGASAIANV